MDVMEGIPGDNLGAPEMGSQGFGISGVNDLSAVHLDKKADVCTFRVSTPSACLLFFGAVCLTPWNTCKNVFI